MRATIYGNVVVAVAQGALGGLAFAAASVPGVALWGSVMAVLSLLPVTGPVLTVDNLLGAVLVGGRAQLHPLAVFLAVLGGLVVFGAAGILLGPVLFVAAYMLIEFATGAVDGKGRPPDSGSQG